jgi:uncharacterized protein YeeX (DUF496 family)
MPSGATILTENGDYYLGEIDETEFWKIKIFQPIPVSDEVASGFYLLNTDTITEESSAGEITTRDLTDEETSNKEAAELFFEKLEIRSQISANVGDNNDLIADINKRISLLERIVYQTLDYLYSSSELVDDIPSDLQDSYGDLLNDYANKVENGEITDCVDLEGVDNIYDKIINRINTTSTICLNYIASKKE